MGLNISVIVGRLTNKPELKTTSSGVSVTSFTVAVERNYTQKSEEKMTDFIDCVAWRSTAEFICNYFDKGQMIAINGEIQTDTYTDKDGNRRKKWEIKVNNVSFCGSSNSKNESNNQAADSDFTEITPEDDLPFGF